MKGVPDATDFIVIGSGVAGLRAAIELAHKADVLVLAKTEYTESNTNYAQGGVAVALSDEDEISLHFQDTLNAGDGLCNPHAVGILVAEGPPRIEELISWGTEFDRNGTKLSFTREAAHSRSRVLHAHGDSTGREIGRALWEKARTMKRISVCEFAFTVELQQDTATGRVIGVSLIEKDGRRHSVVARAVLLATGGLGEVYRDTTNPSVATGDGVAMAFRIGAEISDMEFVQFHPTALYLKRAPRFLLSEALRGEGGKLVNGELVRFMPKYHPMAELAPRDVVARAIAHELAVSKAKDPAVYLDMTHMSEKALEKRFPRIYSTCLQYNIDMANEMVPVRPAAHYAMGGVRTDLDGRTSIAGLYAAGECACTGVHGANRLASNSLLEGLVFGARAGTAMLGDHNHAPRAVMPVSAIQSGTPDVEALFREIQELMWRDVAVVRDRKGLQRAMSELQSMHERMPTCDSRRCWELRNIRETGMLIARAGLARLESRGAHYRTDYPARDDAKFQKHSIIAGDKIRFA